MMLGAKLFVLRLVNICLGCSPITMRQSTTKGLNLQRNVTTPHRQALRTLHQYYGNHLARLGGNLKAPDGADVDERRGKRLKHLAVRHVSAHPPLPTLAVAGDTDVDGQRLVDPGDELR
jgi:hypothetical protein